MPRCLIAASHQIIQISSPHVLPHCKSVRDHRPPSNKETCFRLFRHASFCAHVRWVDVDVAHLNKCRHCLSTMRKRSAIHAARATKIARDCLSSDVSLIQHIPHFASSKEQTAQHVEWSAHRVTVTEILMLLCRTCVKSQRGSSTGHRDALPQSSLLS